MNGNFSSTKKIVSCAVLSALALVSFMIESLFPPLFIPGARIGVSNVFVLLSVIYSGAPFGLITLLTKILLGSVFSGNVSAMLYSLPSGLFSFAIELMLIKKADCVSIVAISGLGGVCSLLIQNCVYCLILGATEYLVYAPYLALIGFVAGLFVGFTVFLLSKALPVKFFRTENRAQDE